MCRWFAYVSPDEDCLLEDVLISPAHSISKQVEDHYLPLLLSHDPKVHAGQTTPAEVSMRNAFFNVDGFGVAWYTTTNSLFCAPHKTSSSATPQGPVLHPASFKLIRPALHVPNFRSICANTASTCVLAHIRAASTGILAEVNVHPFVFGRHTIMHNGYISAYHAVARQMAGLMSAEAYARIGGRTDSEAFAALYMTYLTAGAGHGVGEKAWEVQYSPAEMLDALQNTANTVIDLQQKALGDNAVPNDLNVCVTDGKQLVAMRFRNHPVDQPPSLYHSTTAGVTLNRKYPDEADGAECRWGKARSEQIGTHGVKAEGHNPRAHKRVEEHGKHVIIASEPTTYKKCEWKLIEKNHAIVVDAKGDYEFKEMTYPGQK